VPPRRQDRTSLPLGTIKGGQQGSKAKEVFRRRCSTAPRPRGRWWFARFVAATTPARRWCERHPKEGRTWTRDLFGRQKTLRSRQAGASRPRRGHRLRAGGYTSDSQRAEWSVAQTRLREAMAGARGMRQAFPTPATATVGASSPAQPEAQPTGGMAEMWRAPATFPGLSHRSFRHDKSDTGHRHPGTSTVWVARSWGLGFRAFPDPCPTRSPPNECSRTNERARGARWNVVGGPSKRRN